MHKQPAVYILASKRNGTLYIGVTSNLLKRAWEHKNDLAEGFHEEVRSSPVGLLRVAQGHGVSHNTGEASEKMEQGLEVGTD
jgi:predicted GIY-YIG superfamily endonuclease